VIDLAAEEGSIENLNNQPNAKKLHLISLKSGNPLPTSLVLADLEEILKSGDSVLLEKVDSSLLT